MSEIILTDSNFEETVIKNPLPVLVDFWAVWCGPCQMQNPILEEVVKEMTGKAVIGKLNVDENPSIAQKFGVMSIPTLMLFYKGQIVKQWIGVQSKESLLAEINKVIQ